MAEDVTSDNNLNDFQRKLEKFMKDRLINGMSRIPFAGEQLQWKIYYLSVLLVDSLEISQAKSTILTLS